MPETFTQVCTFCKLVGHYRHFIRGFPNITRLLYGVVGKEVKMGPAQLPPEAQEVVRILKDNIQFAPVLVFPNFDIYFSSWRLMPPRRGWVWCCFRNRTMAAIILLPLRVAPSHP